MKEININTIIMATRLFNYHVWYRGLEFLLENKNGITSGKFGDVELKISSSDSGHHLSLRRGDDYLSFLNHSKYNPLTFQETNCEEEVFCKIISHIITSWKKHPPKIHKNILKALNLNT